MDTTKSETHPVAANILDKVVGDSTKDGAKTEHGEVVTETTTESEDDDG
jgi:hypothetical protein